MCASKGLVSSVASSGVDGNLNSKRLLTSYHSPYAKAIIGVLSITTGISIF